MAILAKSVKGIIQRNGFFGHAENIAMLADESETVRILALHRILKVRQVKGVSTTKNYTDVIDWVEVTVSEPPFTKFLEHTDILVILRYTENPTLLDDFDLQIPLPHKQQKGVSKSSLSLLLLFVVPKEEKDSSTQGYILTSLCRYLTRKKTIDPCDTTVLAPF
nr:unnamed protein product [Callosobruchus analis]